MRLGKHRGTPALAMNMTPMIDVVFQLLIFFMTVSQVSQINRLRLELPQQEGTREQEQGSLTINVDEEGTIFIGGDPVSMAGLVEQVTSRIAELDGEPIRLAVVLRADKRGASRAVNQVVAALSQLGIQRVRVAVESQ